MALSEKELKFCFYIVAGLGQREAYQSAGFEKPTIGATDTGASRLANKLEIKEKIAEMRKEIESDLCLDLVNKRIMLAEIANGRACVPMREELFEVKPTHAERMKAIDIDNKMMGDYAPEKKEVDLQSKFMDELFGE